jgi:NAD(P)-dependent dehydrogenase (short-subunit alcohol dehydrogenase family)
MTDVLVTGAAGGLGGALVAALLARGDRVLSLDRVATARDDVLHVTLDVTDTHALTDAIGAAGRSGLEIRHVVSIAGGALPGEKTCDDPGELPLEVFRASLEHNLVSAWITIQAALPVLRRLGGDRSITVTTSTDALASYGLPAYAAAKAGLIGLVHSLMGGLAADGIRINAVAPGDVPTERNRREWAHRPDWYEGLRAGVPLGRLATPEDVATAYLSLIDLRHVTGQVIVVDGGQTISRPGTGVDR